MKSTFAVVAMSPAVAQRQADSAQLAAALTAGRTALLRLFDAYRTALGAALRVPFSSELNLPLWELGHLGWFEEHWIARNAFRAHGAAVDVEAMLATQPASSLSAADQLYDSSRVPHASRWQLPLPDAARTVDYLARVREGTLIRLRSEGSSDAALYFYRLILFHEAMHREAWIYMAQTLGVGLDIAGPACRDYPDDDLALAGGVWRLGSSGAGFCFDNELGAHAVDLDPFAIDRAVVSWQRYLPFVESGGYDEPRWWSPAGWAWRQSQGQAQPRYLRRSAGEWHVQRFGQWQALEARLPAMNLTQHEAEAWCRWAGRRLPSEAEWEFAASTATGAGFCWGDVWEWTSSPFKPYPGFVAHPYRDYSAPWFDGRPVLRGASFATDPGMRHPRYRNFFTAERNDIFSGFRSCAL